MQWRPGTEDTDGAPRYEASAEGYRIVRCSSTPQRGAELFACWAPPPAGLLGYEQGWALARHRCEQDWRQRRWWQE